MTQRTVSQLRRADRKAARKQWARMVVASVQGPRTTHPSDSLIALRATFGSLPASVVRRVLSGEHVAMPSRPVADLPAPVARTFHVPTRVAIRRGPRGKASKLDASTGMSDRAWMRHESKQLQARGDVVGVVALPMRAMIGRALAQCSAMVADPIEHAAIVCSMVHSDAVRRIGDNVQADYLLTHLNAVVDGLMVGSYSGRSLANLLTTAYLHAIRDAARAIGKSGLFADMGTDAADSDESEAGIPLAVTRGMARLATQADSDAADSDNTHRDQINDVQARERMLSAFDQTLERHCESVSARRGFALYADGRLQVGYSPVTRAASVYVVPGKDGAAAKLAGSKLALQRARYALAAAATLAAADMAQQLTGKPLSADDRGKVARQHRELSLAASGNVRRGKAA